MTRPARIVIDGYNLAIPQGTGVATYARNLSHALHGLGHQVGVLYGKNIGPTKDTLAREVDFFDPPTAILPQWLSDTLRAI